MVLSEPPHSAPGTEGCSVRVVRILHVVASLPNLSPLSSTSHCFEIGEHFLDLKNLSQFFILENGKYSEKLPEWYNPSPDTLHLDSLMVDTMFFLTIFRERTESEVQTSWRLKRLPFSAQLLRVLSRTPAARLPHLGHK